MRSAAIVNWEAEREAGLIPVGPVIRVSMSPRQWQILASCVAVTAGSLARVIGHERKQAVRERLLEGLQELIAIMRALER